MSKHNPPKGNNPAEYTTRECPFCGASCKQLPAHLRYDCEAKV